MTRDALMVPITSARMQDKGQPDKPPESRHYEKFRRDNTKRLRNSKVHMWLSHIPLRPSSNKRKWCAGASQS